MCFQRMSLVEISDVLAFAFLHASLTIQICLKKRFRIDNYRSVAWEFIPISPLSRRGLNPIKPVYDQISRMAGSI